VRNSEPKSTDTQMEESDEVLKAPTTRISRRFNVSFQGSMRMFEQLGNLSATWHPAENTHASMFGTDFDSAENATDTTTTLKSIGNAVIVEAKVLETKSTFPVPVGVSCNVIPGNELTEFGERFLFTALPMGSQSESQLVYKADAKAETGLEWRTLYPTFTKANLEHEGVMQVNQCAYMFVSKNHPAVDVLRENSDRIDNDIAMQTLIDGEWYKVSRQCFTAACKALRKEILSKVHTADLNTLQFQMHRFNGEKWDSITNEEFCYPHSTPEDQRGDLVEMRLTSPCSLHARIELTYELNH
jgi:hypothetical protein